jgi:tetratricopeptide (TPR) repeat protein
MSDEPTPSATATATAPAPNIPLAPRATTSGPFDVTEAFRRGIRLARKDQWHEAYNLFIRISQQVERRGNLPGVFYSYLGVAMARCDGRRRDGMELCRYAVKVQPEQPENHLNLATAYLMLGRRSEALRAVQIGLEVEPTHRRLNEMHERIGVRQRPLFPFLSRSNPLNSVAGRGRAWLRRKRRAAEERRIEIATFGE